MSKWEGAGGIVGGVVVLLIGLFIALPLAYLVLWICWALWVDILTPGGLI
jgi:hypothetical protein